MPLYFEIVYRSSARPVFWAGVSDVAASLLYAQREHRGGGGKQKMADGVDHIDIYADVEEEFNQVRFIFNIYTCLIISILRVARTDCKEAHGNMQRSLGIY